MVTGCSTRLRSHVEQRYAVVSEEARSSFKAGHSISRG
ncbi:MAG: hypothetical protein AVDCRST_MAG29-108 [uncultured Nocardioidaceae bacterium]|uniref:Uncharacterized protein n=1 Tax=uncultured Nocardioidaceae bacterium TaxID=253824 RepID=A0A6J4KWJ0_9ACTN|nr:MAG: hypothetical protein AVDCRST_MAG29-108 [uncultured Nocardioidaceae bacterium]